MDFQKKKLNQVKKIWKELLRIEKKLIFQKKQGKKKNYLIKNLFFQLMEGFQGFLEVKEY